MKRKCCLFILLLLIVAIPSSADEDRNLWEMIVQTVKLEQDGKSDSAFLQATSLLSNAIEEEDYLAQLHLYLIIGTTLRDKSQYQEAIEVFEKAAEICKKIDFVKNLNGREFNLVSHVYSSMAETYAELRNKKKCYKYAVKAAQITMSSSDKNLQAATLPQMGALMVDMGKQYNEAKPVLEKGYQASLEMDLPGNALVAASYLMTIEYVINHHGPEVNRWMKKAQQLLPNVSSDYPLGVYYSEVASMSLRTGNIKQAQEMHEKVMQLPTFGEIYSPEKTKQFITEIEEERNEELNTVAKKIGIPSLFLLFVLLFYALWQFYRRKRDSTNAIQLMNEHYIEGVESEKSRMARELHDGVSNQLLAVEMKLNSEDSLEQTRKMLNESRRMIRQISHGLMPPEFNNATLDEILNNYILTINGVNKCEITYQSSPRNANWSVIPQEMALELYRIIQELIGNILKHTNVSIISVGMKMENQHLSLTIVDNGVELEIKQVHGIGQKTIRQRLQKIKASICRYHTQYGKVVKIEMDL